MLDEKNSLVSLSLYMKIKTHVMDAVAVVFEILYRDNCYLYLLSAFTH